MVDGGSCRSQVTMQVMAHVETTEVDIEEVHRLGRNAVSPLMSQARRNGEGTGENHNEDDYVQELPNEIRLKFVNYVLYVYPSYIIHVMNYIIHVEDYYLS